MTAVDRITFLSRIGVDRSLSYGWTSRIFIVVQRRREVFSASGKVAVGNNGEKRPVYLVHHQVFVFETESEATRMRAFLIGEKIEHGYRRVVKEAHKPSVSLMASGRFEYRDAQGRQRLSNHDGHKRNFAQA